MRFPQAGVSIRDQIVPVPAGQTLFDTLRMIATSSVEAAVNSDLLLSCFQSDDGVALSIVDDTCLEVTRTCLTVHNVRISALLLATDFSGPDADLHVAWASRVIRSAQKLGVPVVRIDPWTANGDLPTKTIADNVVDRVRRLLDATADCNVDIGMENHGKLFNDPVLLDEVLAAIPDSRFGLTLDTGNLYWWGHPLSRVYQFIERYAARTKHTHVKNINYPAEVRETQREIGFEYKQFCGPLDEGNLDLTRIIKALRQGGYDRDFCVEDESLFKFPEADHVEILRRDAESLRRAMEP